MVNRFQRVEFEKGVIQKKKKYNKNNTKILIMTKYSLLQLGAAAAAMRRVCGAPVYLACASATVFLLYYNCCKLI